jgi:tetratricopeptide (TPR) repeat protein
MKKFLLTLGIFCIAGVVGFAQTTGITPQTSVVRTEHYEITAEGRNARGAADALGWELELRFEAFNRIFRFDPAALEVPLKVRAFIDKIPYDTYIAARLGQTRAGSVYLHYNQAERRELVVLQGSGEDSSTLSHQAFVQFLRGFIPNPPAWMREGFAVYFSGLTYDPATGALSYEENLAWLETVKSLGGTALTAKTILESDTAVGTIPQNFQICSWALSSFFLNSGLADYFRTLTDSFMVLSAGATAAENSDALLRRLTQWIDFAAIDRDYRNYLDSRKTFSEIIEEGRGAYAARDTVTAELSFIAARDQRPRHYAPYYYLALIYFEGGNYDLAQEYYLISLEYGADEALVSYALGLNAALAGRSADAITWLQRASNLAPSQYKIRADDLIARLRP